jgi:integrase/recombinase XerC
MALTKKDLKQSYEEGLITKEQFQDELFKLETQPKKKRRSKKLPTYLTPDEFTKLLDATKKYHHKIAFLLAFGSGLRLSEVVGWERPDGDNIPPLEKNKVDLAKKQIFIVDAKNGKQRVVPVPKGFKVKMLDYLPLTKKYKNILSARRSIQKAFADAVKRSGLKETKPTLHFHSLRHSFGTRLVNQGTSINQVQILMGHDNMSTTGIYTHADPQDALKSYEEKF